MDEGNGDMYLEGVSLEETSVSIGWIGQAIKEEDLWGHECHRNDVHWEKGGVCGSPVIFASYSQVQRWSLLGRGGIYAR